MKTTLVLALMVSLAFVGTIAVAQPTKPFPDVPKDHWAYQAVMELKAKGILIGYPGGSFNGQAAKTVKPVYDLSSPMATWHSFLTALRHRDEYGVQYILTKEFQDKKSERWVGIFAIGDEREPIPHNTLEERLNYYEKRAKQWSKLTWDLGILADPKTGQHNTATLTYHHGPRDLHYWYVVALKLTKDGWRIAYIGYAQNFFE